jgi:DNA repair and recombination protein RAD54B
MFEALRTPRRVILSGTPIQNDLGEFHAMADFCNPGLLDSYAAFKKIYETPILRSRAPDCTPKEADMGAGRLEQLTSVAKSFVLRREATILKNYLPPKSEGSRPQLASQR